MKFISVFVGVLLSGQFLFGQGEVFHLNIQVIDSKTKTGVSKKGISLLPLGVGTTDSDGRAVITIPKNTKMVELNVPPGFEIVDPPGPILPVPASEDVVIKFWVNEIQARMMAEEIDRLKQEKDNAAALASSLELKNRLLESQISHLSEENVTLQDSVKAISKQIEAAHHQVSAIDQEIGQYRLAFYDKISNNYQKFLNALLDMQEALKHVSQAFIQEGDLRNFNDRITALNQARNSMHEDHLANVKVVEKYWSKETSIKLMGLYDQALHNTYDDVILPLNNDLIAKLNATWNGNKPRIFAQRKAVKHTKEALKNLQQEIQNLRTQASEVLKLLELDKSS